MLNLNGIFCWKRLGSDIKSYPMIFSHITISKKENFFISATDILHSCTKWFIINNNSQTVTIKLIQNFHDHSIFCDLELFFFIPSHSCINPELKCLFDLTIHFTTVSDVAVLEKARKSQAKYEQSKINILPTWFNFLSFSLNFQEV